VLALGSEQVGDPDQVVGQYMQPESHCRLDSPSGVERTEARSLLDTAKDLFDSLPGVEGLGGALMASSAAINR
jgi:hypothetical protein